MKQESLCSTGEMATDYLDEVIDVLVLVSYHRALDFDDLVFVIVDETDVVIAAFDKVL